MLIGAHAPWTGSALRRAMFGPLDGFAASRQNLQRVLLVQFGEETA
ncbi:MAG: hypothetical protein GX131_06860 [candidate division WS1 bacterium]|jgi:hypothetical protein|nr:hypothetical protein [candidate division WS1 bacterium]